MIPRYPTPDDPLGLRPSPPEPDLTGPMVLRKPISKRPDMSDLPVVPPAHETWQYKVFAVVPVSLDRHALLARIWEACEEAGVRPPGEVRRYFKSGPPGAPQSHEEVVPYSRRVGDEGDEIEVLVQDLPEGTNAILFRHIN